MLRFSYGLAMDKSSTQSDLQAIADRIDQMIALCARLQEENRSLRSSQETLMVERANLLTKNEQARSRVEAMIARLRSLEQNG